MDNLAHALVGAALGRAVADRHVPRAATIGIVAANAPDWTELFLGWPKWTRPEFLLMHRGITHSLIGALVETVALTLIIGGAWRAVRRWRDTPVPPWSWLAACVGVCVLSHLYMDWQGSYGWRPFLPWSSHWYYLDWVAIVDPFFWLVPLIALAWGMERHWTPLAGMLAVGGTFTFFIIRAGSLVAPWVLVVYALLCVIAAIGWTRYWFGPVARQRAAAFALLLLGAYAIAQGIASVHRKRDIQQIAQRRFGRDAKSAALTEVGRPFTWEAIYASGDTVAGDDWGQPRHLHDRRVLTAIETPAGNAMAHFARFLAAEVDTAEKTIYLRDARYAREGRDGWALVRIRMD
jgi:inner membrane protein